MNPFENGMLKLGQNANGVKGNDDNKLENEIQKELDQIDQKKKSIEKECSQQRQLSSDDETLTKMLQDIQSKS